MKPVDVKLHTYFGSCKEINDKNPKFKVGDNVRMEKKLLEHFTKTNY